MKNLSLEELKNLIKEMENLIDDDKFIIDDEDGIIIEVKKSGISIY